MAEQIKVECPTCKSKLTVEINLEGKVVEVLFGKSIHAPDIESATDTVKEAD